MKQEQLELLRAALASRHRVERVVACGALRKAGRL